MDLKPEHFERAHEFLVGGQWSLVLVGSYWQHHNPLMGGQNPNQKGRAGWKDFNGNGTVVVECDEIRGVKFDTLRGKLEGG